MPRRFRPSRGPLALAVLVILAWAGVRCAYDAFQPAPPESLAEDIYAVQRVVDGDTLLLANGARVRLIGVDSPETAYDGHLAEPWAGEATQFARRFVAGGRVRLRFDRERLDRHGRFLAYVWVDGQLLNEELVRAGLARARLDFRYGEAMKRTFQRAEAEAREAERGIWSDSRS